MTDWGMKRDEADVIVGDGIRDHMKSWAEGNDGYSALWEILNAMGVHARPAAELRQTMRDKYGDISCNEDQECWRRQGSHSSSTGLSR